ncbi:endo-1,4-beta-xylanase A precursor [Ruminiclostridium hungatei]|uniref:Beta-xylanase n=1 Tax=Ruminiclostridium hungatei TaxID=48256 RepID=A0A1V4SJL6_RUMHU|nr:endo-1,4-beta-xylanase [Ruminiclostridium hungatei]OPX44078.1 endo-1,4-beta-xylanase A precursor [Ruminiclostridium hungatei]
MSSTIVSNFRKSVALLLVLCLVFTLMPINSVVKAATVTVYHEDFADEIMKVTKAGNASLTLVDKAFTGNDDGKAMYVSGRTNNWDGVDIKFADVGMTNGKTYTIKVTGYVDTDETIPSGAQAWIQAIDSYAMVSSADFEAGEAFTLTGTYTVDTSKDTALRIESDNSVGKNVSFYIGDILIETDKETETVTQELYHEDFADENMKVTKAGNASLTLVDKAFTGNDDGKAMYVSGRINNWDGVDIKFTDVGMVNGKTYTIKVTGYVDTDETIPSGAQAWIQAVDSYTMVSSADFEAGEAFTLTGTYTVDTSKDTALRIESDNSVGKNVSFYIGDILIETDKETETVTQELYHEDFADEIMKVTKAGNASLTLVDKTFTGNDDGKAMYISGRINNWDGVDIKFADVGMVNGKTYTIKVTGYVDTDETIPSGAQAWIQAIDSYAMVSSADFEAGEAFTLTGTYTVDTSKDTALRIESDNSVGKNVSFYIGDILITTETTDGGDTEPTPEEPKDPAIPFTTIDFEDNAAGGFVPRGGAETLTVTNEANHTTGGALSLKVEGRNQTWHGPSLSVVKYVDQGNEYKVTAWVKVITPSSVQLQLSTQVGNGGSAAYVTLMGKTISTSDGWVKYEGTYRYNNTSSGYLTIYVESSNNATASFYIDDISFVKTSSGPIEIQEDIPSIKDVYKDDFLIGNAVAAEDLSGVRLQFLKKHHNAVTAGNAMKPGDLQPTKGNFTFTAADTLVDKMISEGMLVHGHVLVWHQQSPAWMNTTTGGVALSREEALGNLRTHIKTVMEHFGDKVISWDVVNEAIDDNPPNPSDWQASLRKSTWYNAIGPDYVEQAFLAAQEVLDEKGWDIKLYYNDYNEDNQSKSQAIYNMVKDINDRYAETHPGELLIDGVGMQAHYVVTTNPENVKLSLERFISLGVEISITELDIQAGSNSVLPEKLADAQGYLYAQLFKIFKAHAANIARVTIWGTDDATSWRSSANPLLFDKDLQAKPAYYGVIDPDKYMAEHTPTTPEGAKKGNAIYATPTVDGTVDSVWSSAQSLPVNQYQMAWQGATGTAKVLWDDSNLYVLVQVSDAQLDKTSADAWQQDSVEVFFDENNGKTSFYQEDDGQFRVSFENEATFNPSSRVGFESATSTSGTNYTVEMKLPFKSVTPANNKKIGFDVQINDAKDGSRQSAAAWNDLTGSGYQDTSVYGEITLTGKPGSGTDNNTGNNNTNNNSSNNNSNSTDDKSVISVSVPVTVNADGSATVNVTDKVVEDILKNIETVKKTEEKPVVTLKLDTFAKVSGATLKLPGDTLSKIIKADKDASLKVVSADYEIVFDSKTIETISKAGTGETEIKVVKLAPADVAKLPAAAAEKIAQRPVYEFTVTSGGKTVSDFKAGIVTARIPYAISNNEDPNAIVAYWLDGKNNLIPVRGTYNNGYVELKTTHFSKFAVGYNKVGFEDVKTTDSYYAAATYLGARDIIAGASFDAKHAVTRGEAIVMFLKAYNIKPSENIKDNFSDATGEFAGYYAKAKEIGMTSGVGNNRLAADTPVTKEMLYVMLHNMINYLGEFPAAASPAKDQPALKNSSKLAKWSVNSIKKLVETGVVKEDEKTFNNPNADCVREELADILYSVLSR